MKINLNRIMVACLLALAWGIPSIAQAPASEILKADGAIQNQEGFTVLHMTPVNGDFEDCFNDTIPDESIPQG